MKYGIQLPLPSEPDYPVGVRAFPLVVLIQKQTREALGDRQADASLEMLRRKANHRYVWLRLDSDTVEDGLFFVDWGEHLRLAEVVVGMRSTTCKRELEEALKGYDHPVSFIKARASRTSFEVDVDPDGVRNHDDATFYIWRGSTRHPVEFVRSDVPSP